MVREGGWLAVFYVEGKMIVGGIGMKLFAL